jgi:dsDNA-specific endonuclease/ATPase MutS2
MKNIPNDVFFLVQGAGITTLGSTYDGMFLDLIVPSIKVQELISNLTQTLNQKKYLEKDLLGQLQTSINQYKHQIQYALNIVARIDTLLARAFYGYQYSGIFPQHIYHEGCISIKSFVHPVLALLDEEPSEVVPIDLDLMDSSSANNNATKPALIISGANGGGKTLGDTYHMKNLLFLLYLCIISQ